MVNDTVVPIHLDRPQPRIVQHNKRRYSVRLENVFWRALERLADSRQLRLGRLVAALAESYSGGNFSSYLRSYCMAEFERGQFARGFAETDDGVLGILAACPAPGMLLSAARVVLAHNAAFSAWLGPGHPPLLQAPLTAHFQLRPGPALTQAAEALSAGAAFTAAIQLVYSAPGRASLSAGRLVALRAAGTGGGGMLIWLALPAARLAPVAPPRPPLAAPQTD